MAAESNLIVPYPGVVVALELQHTVSISYTQRVVGDRVRLDTEHTEIIPQVNTLLDF